MMVRAERLIEDASSHGAPQIGVKAIRPMVALLRTSSVDVDRFLSPFGLTTKTIDDPEGRIPLVLLDPLWQRASEVVGDRDLGLHAAESVTAGSFGILSYLGVTSATWRRGLDLVCKYFRLFSDASEYRLESNASAVDAIAYHGVEARGPVRHRVEFTVAVLYCYGRTCIEGDWVADDVFFEHEALSDCSEHCRLFGRMPRFGAPRSGFRFAASLLDRPLKSCDPELHRLLEQQAAQALAAVSPARTVSWALYGTLMRGGPGTDLSLAGAARRLGLSARTLQRRLHDEGTTLGRVVDDVRHAMATHLLTRPELAISEVAFALGFSEPAAFHHAFKRWTGLTPSEFRRTTR